MNRNLDEALSTIITNLMTASETVSTERRYWDTSSKELRNLVLERAMALAEVSADALRAILAKED